MRTKYIRPEILVVRLQHQSIICGSPVVRIQSDANINYGGAGGSTEGSVEAFSRESGSIWDEEW